MLRRISTRLGHLFMSKNQINAQTQNNLIIANAHRESHILRQHIHKNRHYSAKRQEKEELERQHTAMQNELIINKSPLSDEEKKLVRLMKEVGQMITEVLRQKYLRDMSPVSTMKRDEEYKMMMAKIARAETEEEIGMEFGILYRRMDWQ